MANIFVARIASAAGISRLACVKTLRTEFAHDEESVGMFLDEARLAGLIQHPNCVRILDLGEAEGVFYIAMEHLFGETLWNIYATSAERETPVPHDVLATILAAACDGLHGAHELRDADGDPYEVVHRDVSPSNIVVTYDGQTKLIDFGTAKARTERPQTALGVVKGKFGYMSPEQLRCETLDRRSDIFSLGVVMYEGLASRRLFDASSPEEAINRILGPSPPRIGAVVSDVPHELDQICMRALARDRGDRFETARQMGDALRAYLDTLALVSQSRAVSDFMGALGGPTIEAKRRVLNQAKAGLHDTDELIAVLGAAPVTGRRPATETTGSSDAVDPAAPMAQRNLPTVVLPVDEDDTMQVEPGPTAVQLGPQLEMSTAHAVSPARRALSDATRPIPNDTVTAPKPRPRREDSNPTTPLAHVPTKVTARPDEPDHSVRKLVVVALVGGIGIGTALGLLIAYAL